MQPDSFVFVATDADADADAHADADAASIQKYLDEIFFSHV